MMTTINLLIENECNIWQPDENNIKNIVFKIFNFYKQDNEISQNWCLKDLEYESLTFDFFFCDGRKSHQINREYREKDYVADVITFAIFADSPKEERFILEGDINLGEVIFALDKIEEVAQEKEISKETELYFLISHGILHLLGFDHQTENDYNFVVSKQKQALESIGIMYDKI